MTMRSRILPTAIAASLAIAGIAAAPATAAKKPKAPSYVAVANGVAGVSSEVRISAPRYSERTVTIAASQPGSPTVALPVILDVAGNGVVSWTPSAAGVWAIQGQGAFAVATGSAISVAPVPTETTVTVAAQGQEDAPMDVYATVRAVAGSIAPQGSVTFSTLTGATLGSAALTPGANASSTARISWTPSSTGAVPIIATYNPALGTAGAPNTVASVSSPTAVLVQQTQPLLTIRVPSTMRIGQPAVVAGVVNNVGLQGTVALTSDANGTTTSVLGSTTLRSGVGEGTWVPSVSGPQIITAAFSASNSNTSASQTQRVNVLAPKPADAISVGPRGQGAWPVGTAVNLTAGSSVALAIGTQSGAPVTMATSGPCLVINETLFPTADSGDCNLTVSSTGTAAYGATDINYTISIQRSR